MDDSLVCSTGLVCHCLDRSKLDRHWRAAMCCGRTKILIVSFLLSFQVQQAVASPQLGHPLRAERLSV